MSAMSHEFDLSLATMLPPAGEQDLRINEPAALSVQWDAVHEAAAAVGILAQLGEEPVDAEIRGLPERAVAIGGAKLGMVVRGVDDLAAVMQPGLRALLSLTAQGQDTTSAALTLWREFHNAREAILALAPAE
ncbi:hypothetical protein K3152_10420 [Qipengyuania sp. 1NDH17]|uniref:Uncharacterized protein n=1 Tax=Qipengyuania polymorpha TaxID=2867234 RepID=A0ABS7IYM2_9SPHN|nr:hypothetical protein [Qipengyuania polymorpha]MBX7458658.1 hypothetical protein [Qipengyuania polymorpha]